MVKAKDATAAEAVHEALPDRLAKYPSTLVQHALEELCREDFEAELPRDLEIDADGHIEGFEIYELPELLEEDEANHRREFEDRLPAKMREFMVAVQQDESWVEVVEERIRKLAAPVTGRAGTAGKS